MADKNREELLKQVRAALERETRVNLHRFPVHMELSRGDLTLEGEVENIAAKKIALALAASVRGVGGIVDRLRVAPAEKMSDGEIRYHLCSVLIQEPALRGCAIRLRADSEVEVLRESSAGAATAIEVAVEDGVVVLNGNVMSLSQQRLAGVLAWWVPGIRDLINGLEVAPPEEDNDDEVTDAVRLALEKDPFVDATQIRVSTRDYIVTLEGWVPSEKVGEMAEFDAWYVLGVERVVNKLAAQHT